MMQRFFSSSMVRQFTNPRPGSILYNKYLLYALFFMAIFQLFHAIMGNQFIFSAYFLLIGIVISFFSKNMIVILTLTMAIATILKTAFVGTALEGMETKDPDMEAEGMEEAKLDITTVDPKEVAESMETKKKGKDSSKKGSSDSTSSSSDEKVELMETVKKDAKELVSTQQKILDGFETIQPYMDKAEDLLLRLNSTAQTLQKIRQ
jgi:hypothetical protein